MPEMWDVLQACVRVLLFQFEEQPAALQYLSNQAAKLPNLSPNQRRILHRGGMRFLV